MAGRQREFCKENTLDIAMNVFWKMGYVGASLGDLTEAMGINKPSLYSAFGNKEQLFVQSVQHYLDSYAKPHGALLQGDGPLSDRVKAYLLSILCSQCQADGPKGCFITQSISELEGGVLPAQAADMVLEVRDFAENQLAQFFATEKSAGNLNADADPEILAKYVVTILHGTAAMARSGKTKQELESIIDVALSALKI